MNDADLAGWRRAVRRGDLPAELIENLKVIVLQLVRRRALPPAFAPYGRWDDEAADETFSAWYSDRLLGSGQLLALLDRASSPAGFRGLVERSVRQHLLNSADRSQTRNLFARIVALLQGEADTYARVGAASQPADTWFALTSAVAGSGELKQWSGSSAQLAAHAWALGDLDVIRYRVGAAKLSPLLATSELRRFINGMLVGTASALTPRLLLAALAARVTLDDPATQVDFDVAAATAARTPTPDVVVALDDSARMIIEELNARQREILRRVDDPVAAIARDLGCSVGTVVNERRRIGTLVTRLTADDAERDLVLNVVADRLYVRDNDV